MKEWDVTVHFPDSNPPRVGEVVGFNCITTHKHYEYKVIAVEPNEADGGYNVRMKTLAVW